MRKENAEFMALFEASKWSQAEVARRLDLEPGTVSRYLSEDPAKQIAPSPQVIKLFRFILAYEEPKGAVNIQHLELSLDETQTKLAELKQQDPDAYRSLKGTIDVLHERIARGPDEAGRRAVEDVKKPGVTYGRRKRKSGGAKPSVAGAAEKLLRGSADIVRNSES